MALWGASHPSELDLLKDILGWHLDDEASAHIDEVLAQSVKHPVGPEFMAPRNMRQSPQLSQRQWSLKQGIVAHLDCSGYS